jgi:hypothetical protein
MSRRFVMAGLLCLAACGEGVERAPGLDQPIRVPDGTFHRGPLPGAERGGEPESTEGPRVTALEAPGGIGTPGQPGRAITGRTSAEAHAIAFQLDGYGDGYWVRPVDGPDPANNGERQFRIAFDLAEDAPPGKQILRFVALDGNGAAGIQRQLRLCVTSPLPDNLNACDPKLAPPALVVRLEWDALADVDLRVMTPAGRWVSAEHPRTLAPDSTETDEVPADEMPAMAEPVDPTVGVIDRDAGQGCRREGPRAEHLVFQEKPAKGRYLVYARLFDGCGASAVRVRGSLHARVSGPDGTWSQDEIYGRAGVLPAETAGEAALGTYLFPLDF